MWVVTVCGTVKDTVTYLDIFGLNVTGCIPLDCHGAVTNICSQITYSTKISAYRYWSGGVLSNITKCGFCVDSIIVCCISFQVFKCVRSRPIHSLWTAPRVIVVIVIVVASWTNPIDFVKLEKNRKSSLKHEEKIREVKLKWSKVHLQSVYKLKQQPVLHRQYRSSTNKCMLLFRLDRWLFNYSPVS